MGKLRLTEVEGLAQVHTAGMVLGFTPRSPNTPSYPRNNQGWHLGNWRKAGYGHGVMFGPEGGAGEKESKRGRARCSAGTMVRAGNGSPARFEAPGQALLGHGSSRLIL